MLYSGTTNNERNALRVREHRDQLRRLHRNLYTDDFDRPAEEIVRENLLAIAAALLPDWHLSHSSAATLGPIEGMLFMSGPGKAGRHIDLPGTRIIRLPALEAPETESVLTPTPVARAADTPAEHPRLSVSTPLQIVFECLATSRTYPEKNLPDITIAEMISRLSPSDRTRAERFAARNGLRREYLRFRGLSFDAQVADQTRLAGQDSARIFFYGWEVGTLTYLGGGEHRFEYAPSWTVALSPDLPLTSGVSYEGKGMPAFFENCLPEGWTESVVLASNKISREDLFGLFSTTRKYLSNLTLRPLGIPDDELVYDVHSLRIGDLSRDTQGVALLQEALGGPPDDVGLWRRTRNDGPLRLSGVQAKLPVSLSRGENGDTIRIGDLRHACTHILKVPVAQYPNLVENEWATMELARRVGLPAAPTTMVRFQQDSAYTGRSLLVERYDIPDRTQLEKPGTTLLLQEDACSLLSLRRDEKYGTSIERVADALTSAGVGADGEHGMRQFLLLVAFSWIVGNGDLHAKNVSILHQLRSSGPGEPPRQTAAQIAPFYDLVNTRLHLKGDEFALPLDGRANKLRAKSFVRLGSRWGMSRSEVLHEVEQLVRDIMASLESVLARSTLPEELQREYAAIVHSNVDGLEL